MENQAPEKGKATWTKHQVKTVIQKSHARFCVCDTMNINILKLK